MKKRAISHGILALLYDIFESDSTDFTIKRFINTKILAFVDVKDITDQIEVLQYRPGSTRPKDSKNSSAEKENQQEMKTPAKSHKLSQSLIKSDPMVGLAVMGNSIQNTSPKQGGEHLIKGLLHSGIRNNYDLQRLEGFLQKHVDSLETRQQQKIRTEEENRKKKQEELKRNQDQNADKDEKRFKAKR